MNATVFVDSAGATIGGGARFRIELYSYLERTGREDIKLVGVDRHLEPWWLLRREMTRPGHGTAGCAKQRRLHHPRRRAMDSPGQCLALPERRRG